MCIYLYIIYILKSYFINKYIIFYSYLLSNTQQQYSTFLKKSILSSGNGNNNLTNVFKRQKHIFYIFRFLYELLNILCFILFYFIFYKRTSAVLTHAIAFNGH